MEIFQVIYPSQFNLCEARGTYSFIKKNVLSRLYRFIMSIIVSGAGALCITADTRIL